MFDTPKNKSFVYTTYKAFTECWGTHHLSQDQIYIYLCEWFSA